MTVALSRKLPNGCERLRIAIREFNYWKTRRISGLSLRLIAAWC